MEDRAFILHSTPSLLPPPLQHFPSDVELQLQWLHSVAEMRVQQVEQDPSPTKIEPLISLVDRISETLIHTQMERCLVTAHYAATYEQNNYNIISAATHTHCLILILLSLCCRFTWQGGRAVCQPCSG